MIAKLSGIAKQILLNVASAEKIESPFFTEGDTVRMRHDAIKIEGLGPGPNKTGIKVSFMYRGNDISSLEVDRADLDMGDTLILSGINGSQQITVTDN